MLPVRVVIDTNIVVSAALKPEGLQRTVFLIAITKPARFYVSDEIVSEYRDVLARRELGIPKGRQRQLLDLIGKRAYLVRAVRRLSVASDPDDNIFVECADAARAHYIVTGNSRHFPKVWKSTRIVTSREFLGLVAPHLIR